MKKLMLLVLVCISSIHFALSQSVADKVKEKAKDKTKSRVENKTDETIDKGLDGIENGIKSLFKKKKKKETKKEEAKDGEETVDEKKDATAKKNSDTTTQKTAKSLAVYSKFDFIAGEKIIVSEDFERLNIGDFPAEWNSNASGEIVTVDGKEGKWLNLAKNGSFIPEYFKTLDENFTLEFDAGLIGNPGNNYSGFGINFNTDKDKLMEILFAKGSYLYLHPGAALASIKIDALNSDNVIENDVAMPQWDENGERFVHISIWRQKGRIRVYMNESKIIDIPRFFIEKEPYSFSFFRRFFEDCQVVFTNVKYAIGKPDTRSKLFTEGKFVTTGILFEFQKANVKPESYGILKEIATALKENPTAKIKIIGHTSNDGDASANLTLSKERAIAVKQTLATEFGIDANQLSTDGKGGAEPIDTSNTPIGKANNRRVEFIKL